MNFTENENNQETLELQRENKLLKDKVKELEEDANHWKNQYFALQKAFNNFKEILEN